MVDNIREAQINTSEMSRFKKFYTSYKNYIIFLFITLFLLFASYSFYIDTKNKKRISLSENFIDAKINLQKENKNDALILLKEIIYLNDSTYSTLSFFLILDQNLIEDYTEVSILFDHLLKNNKFKKEMKYLLIYKKAIFNSNFATESALLEEIKPLINEDSIWKSHALLLLGDYFVSKEEYLKAKDFYTQVLTTKNSLRNHYDKATNKLGQIAEK
jgi:hypothetical protein